MKIILFPAQNGDCILVSVDNQTNILIDTGYESTYKNYLKPVLQQLAQQKKALDYCVITHVDADHIEGAVKGLFFENGPSNDPTIIPIRNVWHNSYRHLQAIGVQPLTDKDRFGLRAIIAKGMNTTVQVRTVGREISTHQGSLLAALLTRNQYNWNTDFNGKAVEGPCRLVVNHTTEIIILSPTAQQLKRLDKHWAKDLQKLGIKKGLTADPLLDEAYEYWLAQHNKRIATRTKPISARSHSIADLLSQCFEEDNSPTNGSSIAFVIQTNETRFLMLGDAWPTVVEDSLRKAYPEQKGPIWFDAIKVSHHGSFANNSPALLQLTDSNAYLFSTDGSKHNHPDPETVAWIITRPLTRGTIRQLCFNYKTPTSQLFENADWQHQYKYNVIYGSHEVPISVTL